MNALRTMLASLLAVAVGSPSPAQDDVNDASEVAMKAAMARVAPFVAKIETSGGQELVGGAPGAGGPQAGVRKGVGPTTGLVVAPDGYVISSSFNFANKPTDIFVSVPGKPRLVAKVIATDQTRMLTLLKVDLKGLAVPVAVPKADITTYTARQLLALNDKAVSTRLGSVWGTVRPASATRIEQTAKLKALLTPETLAKADHGNGRKLYAANCASCHKLFDDGGNVGPELTGAQRTSLDYVLENVLDPSAVVPSDYRLTTFALIDGRTVAGIVRKETPQTLTIRTLNEEVLIPVADIESRKTTQLSIMPDGLFDKLTDAELRDLVGYLASPRQVPLAALPK